MLSCLHRNRILLLLFLAAWGLHPEILFAKNKSAPVPVGVAKVEAFAPSTVIDLPGTVQPWAISRLAAEIDGRVDKIMVKEGEYVKKESILVQMRTVPLELELDLARAEHLRVATLLEELKTGTRVEVVDAAKFNKEQAAARLQLAESELKRVKELYKEGVLSLDEFDKSQSQADAARAEYQTRQEVYKEAVAGPRIERIKQEEANLAAAQAKIDIIVDQIDRASLRAPFNGYIVKKETEVGEWLETGDPALSMMTSYPVKVEVNLPQFHFDKIQIGTPARIIVEGYGDDKEVQHYKGRVIEKVSSGNAESRTFPTRIRVNATGRRVPPGMLVRVELTPATKNKKEVYVPKDALVQTPEETAVWVIKGKGNVRAVSKVLVTPGKESRQFIAVQFAKNSIKAGDLVVVQGNERLKPDSQVMITTK